MLDLGQRWPAAPDFASALIEAGGIKVTPINGLSRHLVSGNLDFFLQKAELDAAVGALGLAMGDRYAMRLARDRMMVVGMAGDLVAPGWHDEGFAVTNISAAFQAFAIEGAFSSGLLQHATFLDVANPGPSANVPFANYPTVLHAHETSETLMLHVERGLAAALFDWLDGWSKDR